MARRALLVGINHYPDNPLRGCVNDVAAMATLMTNKGLFAASEWRVCIDERASADEIRHRLDWLVKGAQAGDEILFYFSGHGVQLPHRNDAGTVDRIDEMLCGVDFDADDITTHVSWDYLTDTFGTLPAGSRLTWIVDACHSGLPASGSARAFALPLDVGWARNAAAAADGIAAKTIREAIPQTAAGRSISYLAACADGELARETTLPDGTIQGALTAALIACLSTADGLSMRADRLIDALRELIGSYGIAQRPELVGDANALTRPLFAAATQPPNTQLIPPPATVAAAIAPAAGSARACNAATIALIKHFEGIRDGDPSTPNFDPYLDPVQIWTIGWGHAIADGGRWLKGTADAVRARALFPNGISLVEAEALLRTDLMQCAAQVQAEVAVSLNDNQFGALASFTFNLGLKNLKKSTLLKKLNAGDYAGAAAEFEKWIFADGKVLPGLVRRRDAEKALFLIP